MSARLWMYAIAFTALTAMLGGAAWTLYSKGKEAGIAECQAQRTEAVETTQKAIDQNTRTASETSAATASWLWAVLPPIDLRTNEARERVRNVYRETASLPAADRCSSPARDVRVQADLDAARARIIAAAAGSPVRASPNPSAATGTGLHEDPVMGLLGPDGRLGLDGHGPDRSGSGQGSRLAYMRGRPAR